MVEKKSFRSWVLTICIATYILIMSTPVLASADESRSNFLLIVYFKAVRLKDVATENIIKLEKEISENKNSISRAEEIIRIARGRTDTKAKQAEQIATEALQKSREALFKNEQTLNKWKLKRLRAEKSLATIMNMMSGNLGSSQKIKGVVSDYSGRVDILKTHGETVTMDTNSLGLIEAGDEVWTMDGTATVEMLDGRGSATIGPYSKLKIVEDTQEKQVVELLQGKVYMAVNKVDDYIKKLNEVIQKYKEDIKTINEWTKEYIDEKTKELRLYLKENSCKHNPHRCINIGVRGTKFTSEIKTNNMEIKVLEGAVGVYIPEKDKTLSVEAGNQAIISSDIIKVEKIEKIERWWENEDSLDKP